METNENSCESKYPINAWIYTLLFTVIVGFIILIGMDPSSINNLFATSLIWIPLAIISAIKTLLLSLPMLALNVLVYKRLCKNKASAREIKIVIICIQAICITGYSTIYKLGWEFTSISILCSLVVCLVLKIPTAKQEKRNFNRKD